MNIWCRLIVGRSDRDKYGVFANAVSAICLRQKTVFPKKELRAFLEVEKDVTQVWFDDKFEDKFKHIIGLKQSRQTSIQLEIDRLRRPSIPPARDNSPLFPYNVV